MIGPPVIGFKLVCAEVLSRHTSVFFYALMDYFTSDTHFGHLKVIDYCRRPFTSVEHMDDELIRRWNSVVRPNDTIYHMGDFSFHKPDKIKQIISQLNGHKILVMGNHDHKHTVTKWKRLGFHEVWKNGFYEIKKTGFPEFFNLSHFPYLRHITVSDARDFSKYQLPNCGGWLLHGHVHNGWRVKDRMINVGVDQWDWRPVALSNILEIVAMAEQI